MFDIGFSELCLVAVIALLVVGPKRLPETVRAWGRWTARARQALETLRQEVEQELDLEEVRRIGEEYRRDQAQAGDQAPPRSSPAASRPPESLSGPAISAPAHPPVLDAQDHPEGHRS